MNEAISSVEDSRGFAIVDIAIPTLYRLAGLVLLILALKDIVELVSDVTNSQTLFTEDKNKSCKKLLLVVFIGLFFVIKSLILWLAVGTMLEIVAYLFNYCVQLTNSKK